MKLNALNETLSQQADRAAKIQAEATAIREAFANSNADIPPDAEAALSHLDSLLADTDATNQDIGLPA